MSTIAAVLCWYDEPVESLERCIKSVTPLVDVIVHADGAWDTFPHVNIMSVDEQHAMIDNTARENKTRCTHIGTLTRDKPYESQCDKRTYLYRAASLFADYILVIDADEELELSTPVDDIKQQIKRNTRAAYNLKIVTPHGVNDTRDYDAAIAPHGVRYQPRLLEANTSLTIGTQSHRTITTDTQIIQCENTIDMHVNQDKKIAERLTLNGIEIINHTYNRDTDRINKKIAYGYNRKKLGQD